MVLAGVMDHIDFTRKVGDSSLPDSKLRALIKHFNEYRLRNTDFEHTDLLGSAYDTSSICSPSLAVVRAETSTLPETSSA